MEKQSTSTTPRTAYVLLVVAAGVVCLMGMQQLAGIVAPLLLTINLFIAAYPIQSWLVRVGVPRIVAQSLLGLVVLLILALFLYALVWSVRRLLGELPG